MTMAKTRNPAGYSAAEQRARMADFARLVRQARDAWRRGEAVVILSFAEYLRLTARPTRGRRDAA